MLEVLLEASSSFESENDDKNQFYQQDTSDPFCAVRNNLGLWIDRISQYQKALSILIRMFD